MTNKQKTENYRVAIFVISRLIHNSQLNVYDYPTIGA